MSTLSPETSVDETFTAEWTQWRADRERAIAAPDGILPIVSIDYLSAESIAIDRLPGRWSSTADGIRVELAGDETLFDGADRVSDSVILPRPGAAPAFHRHDGLTIEVIHASGWDIVRVRDAGAPALVGYAGTPVYPADPAWRLRGRWVPRAQALQVATVSERVSRQVESPGVVAFELGGVRRSLVAVPAHDRPGHVALLFRDRTSGVTTYAAQRELLVELPSAGDEVVVDFNRAYNKPCAYSDFALCPLPPEGNVLDVAIEAGERIPYERGGAGAES